MPTVEEYVYAGAERLRCGPHPERALQDAERLLMHVLGKDRAWMLAYWRDEIDTACSIPYHGAIERRRMGEPIQYIVGETEFYGLPFRVTRDVLIPRPETEHAVEKVLELAASLAAPRIVDVGTGSGAIAVAVAHQLPHAAITAIDLSPAALAIACQNAAQNGVADSIRFCQGDLLAPVAGEPFDIVVSNPPYVAESDRCALAVEVRDHEPEMALFAGEQGLTIYRRLIPQAFSALAAGGWLVLEIGCGQQSAVAALLEQAGFVEIGFTADLQGIMRVAAAQRPL
ncbi:MAG: peptide chain release factor N(5)-glutamine methyltransferase [Acidobacteriota bacterium]